MKKAINFGKSLAHKGAKKAPFFLEICLKSRPGFQVNFLQNTGRFLSEISLKTGRFWPGL
jgi:hypothetical protein